MALSFNIQAAQSHTKPTDISKLTTGDFIAPREKKSSFTPQNTNTSFPNQETLKSHHPNPPTVRNLQNKKEPQNARIQKGHPKHSNLNKMKRQRNTQQVKEQDKCPSNQKKKRRR